MTANFKKLQELMDTNCQIIYPGNWQAQSKAGWRWALNIYLPDIEKCIEIFKDYQYKNGPLNVTLGTPFSEERMKPVPVPTLSGLYVRDVEDQIIKFRGSLNDSEEISRWLNNGGA